jgi:hypothetical protein
MIALERALRIGQDEAPREDDFEQLIQGGWRRDEVSREGGSRGVKRDLTDRRVGPHKENRLEVDGFDERGPAATPAPPLSPAVAPSR